MLVLIPTAGIGSRLDFNTRYMNKSQQLQMEIYLFCQELLKVILLKQSL